MEQGLERSCAACVLLVQMGPLGRSDPRSLLPKAIWQMDVTHYQSFGNFRYVHMYSVHPCIRQVRDGKAERPQVLDWTHIIAALLRRLRLEA